MGNIFNCFKNRSNDQNIEYDDNFKEYFKMIHNKVYKFYKENQTNQFNITISLDKKDFNQISIPKKVKLNHTEKFIYWKDYIVDYLIKHMNLGKENWVIEVLNKIDDEIFLKENKWLSLFFWQEFELRTRPAILIDENNAINSIDDDLESKRERQRLDSNISDKFHFSSFHSNNSNINDIRNDVKNKQVIYREYKKKVKSYISIFNEHLNEKEHPINIIIDFFLKAFPKWVQRIITEIKREYNRVSIKSESSNFTKQKNYIFDKENMDSNVIKNDGEYSENNLNEKLFVNEEENINTKINDKSYEHYNPNGNGK